ncbi:hypothetical protein GWI33_005454 [Rhynchophorus ferrugineus]|uniref:Uncharacterized protein n=1 Tax=Rhynchophorus ferrugineus TaxID=354439 RepID=A0A834IHH2_RHYFE|nr:hypothetical protein GWI33_005454 [Rhynchophorus ferrugineus]
MSVRRYELPNQVKIDREEIYNSIGSESGHSTVFRWRVKANLPVPRSHSRRESFVGITGGVMVGNVREGGNRRGERRYELIEYVERIN